MRQSNNEIIAEYKQENGLAPDFEIYSAQAWHKQGYQVKRGSVCRHRVKLFPAGKFYLKEFSLFTREQVELR